jgi:hypothetical protein
MERVGSPGRTSPRYLRMGMLRRRQLSTTEKMAAIFGPASLLPRCSQFFLLCEDLHGRKNYLFAGADSGGERAAAI